MVLDALKKRLHDTANSKGGKWIKELPNALWGLRTQPSKPSGQSPYFLVYGSEAILPADVMSDSPAVEQYDEGVSEDSRRVDIDGLEEARCAALVQSARYQEGIRCYHDRNVKERSFNVGDLVLRRIQNMKGLHKLSSPWEGPLTVAKVLTDERSIPLRSASVRTPHLFHHGIPKVLVNPRSKGITSVQSTSKH
jgi:hypothetical protein